VKIGLVTPYVYPLPGGVNDHVGHLYESLRARGHDVRILTASHGLQRRSEGDVIRIGKGFSVPANGSMGTITISPRYRSQIRSVLDAERFDLLHFHEPFVPFLTLVALRESSSVNVATFHAYAGYAPGYQLGGRILGPVAASRLHGRIAVSAAARHFADRYLPGDYKVIPNGVDLRRFAHAVPLARWQDGRPNILFVGRLEPRKGLLHLLKAFRMIRKAGADSRLLVVGSGPLEREARRYVMTRRLGGVEFLGRVSDQEKVQLFRTADVYVSPATGRESFGIVLLEAMAAGTSIVCSDIHGYKGVVRRDQEAVLVPPGDHRAIAEAVLRLLADPALRERMGASGLERAQSFGWDRIAERVEAYYGFVIRRLAAQGSLPLHFDAEIPVDERRPVAPA
jgi:phosphatidylinositol alpha-mannosyltransferase